LPDPFHAGRDAEIFRADAVERGDPP
jgi:hypothetical protein